MPALAPLVIELGTSFALVDGQPIIPEEKFLAWVPRLDALRGAERTTIATDLVALAARFFNSAPEATEGAVFQLSLLAVRLIDDDANVAQVMQKIGMSTTAAQRLIGAEPVPMAMNNAPFDPKKSPLAARIAAMASSMPKKPNE